MSVSTSTLRSFITLFVLIIPSCPLRKKKLAFGYKALMKSYQNQVIHLAGDQHKEEVQLVVNLFQSVLDGFIRGEMKKGEADPAKVTY